MKFWRQLMERLGGFLAEGAGMPLSEAWPLAAEILGGNWGLEGLVDATLLVNDRQMLD